MNYIFDKMRVGTFVFFFGTKPHENNMRCFMPDETGNMVEITSIQHWHKNIYRLLVLGVWIEVDKSYPIVVTMKET